MKDLTNKKPTGYDLTVPMREGFYLPPERQEHEHRSKLGYKIKSDTNSISLKADLKIDFENYVLPYLDKLNSIQDCLAVFGKVTFFGENLKKIIEDNKLLVK